MDTTQLMFRSAPQLELDQLDEQLSKLGLKRQVVLEDSFYCAVVRQFQIKNKEFSPSLLRSKCAKFLGKNDVIGPDDNFSWMSITTSPEERAEYLRQVANLDVEYIDSNIIQAAASVLQTTITIINSGKKDSIFKPIESRKKQRHIQLARLGDAHFYSVEKDESVVSPKTLRKAATLLEGPGPDRAAIKSPASAKKTEEFQKITAKAPTTAQSTFMTTPPTAKTQENKKSTDRNEKKRNSSAAESDLEDLPESKWKELFPTEVEEEKEKEEGFLLYFVTKSVKYISTLILFAAVLLGGITTKSTFLVLANAYTQDYSSSTCPSIVEGRVNAPYFSRYMVMLILLSCLCFPELVAFCYSSWKIAKKKEPPMRWSICLAGMIPEVLHAVGLTFLTLQVIPNIDATLACVLFSLIALNPSIQQVTAMYTIFAYYRDKDLHGQSDVESLCSSQYDEQFQQYNKAQKKRDFILSAIATPLLVTGYGLIGWQIFETTTGNKTNILICSIVSLVLMSTRYWENFMLPRKPNVDEKGGEIKGFSLPTLQREIEELRFKTSAIYSIVRLCVIVSCCFLIHFVIDNNMAVVERRGMQKVYFKDARITTKCSMIVTSLWFAGLTNCLCSLGTFVFGSIACQTRVQRWSFVIPLALVTPAMSSLTSSFTMVGSRSGQTLMDFFDLPVKYSFANKFIGWRILYRDVDPQMMAAIVIVGVVTGCLGLVLTTSYSWQENKTAISRVEALFVKPIHSGPFITEVMLLNRRQYELTAKKWYDKRRREFVPQVFLCTTMWHESEQEMANILTSILRLDRFHAKKKMEKNRNSKHEADFFNFEVHVLFDDAIVTNGGKKPKVNDYVKQLLNLIPTSANTVESKSGKNIVLNVLSETPYGGRIEILLPNDNWMYIHLKDKTKIRVKKRWSQCMYMCYILRYLKEVKKHRYRPSDVFILALDGDVDFQPPALVYLLDLMKKDPDVGAACGRVHPTGSGPVIWFQKFEYAVGHWLQKTAEDVLGCVLCSPGCFSLFRGEALMKKNVVGTYMKQASEPRHKIQWDQGEDRWLCTLLLKQGTKIEYCAASDSYTFAPEEFKEFYDQRRRWGPSTLANVFDVLLDAKVAVEKNENISWGYIAYQMGLMAASLLGPSTVVLAVESSLQYVFGMSAIGALMTAVIPVVIFIIICYTTKPAFQIVVAGILTIAYALVMMAVLVGIIGQMVDSILNPSSLFMLFMISIYTVTGLIHPTEMLCLLHGLIYYLCVPSAFVFLPIYSYCNMDNVSWGTREYPKQTTSLNSNQGEIGETSGLTVGRNTAGGNYGCGWGNMCRCLVCINSQSYQPLPAEEPTPEVEKEPHEKSKLSRRRWKKLQNKFMLAKTFFMGEKGDGPAGAEKLQQKKPIEKKVYFEIEATLPTMHICDLDEEETNFWKDIIKFYLKPVDEHNRDEKEKEKSMKRELKRLKNKMSGAYLFINSLWLVLTFSLAMIIQDVNITLYDKHENPTVFNPVAFLFLAFFLVILVVQFVAMLFHRWNTFIHLMAKTNLFKEQENSDAAVDSGQPNTVSDQADGPSTLSNVNHEVFKGAKNSVHPKPLSHEPTSENVAPVRQRVHMADMVLQAIASTKLSTSVSFENSDHDTEASSSETARNANVISESSTPRQGWDKLKPEEDYTTMLADFQAPATSKRFSASTSAGEHIKFPAADKLDLTGNNHDDSDVNFQPTGVPSLTENGNGSSTSTV